MSGKLGARWAKTRTADCGSTTNELFWAAGFLEGEGSFSRAQKGSERVEAKQVSREPVERLRNIFGGSINVRELNKKNPNHNDIYVWAVSGARARGVCQTLYGTMSTRRQAKIREILAPVDSSYTSEVFMAEDILEGTYLMASPEAVAKAKKAAAKAAQQRKAGRVAAAAKTANAAKKNTKAQLKKKTWYS